MKLVQDVSLVLVDKPEGVTSFDCIRSLKKVLNRSDIGHGGTLDRFASGLLPVFAGEGLKLCRFLMEPYPKLSTYWKTYQGKFEFGKSTETGDPEGVTVVEKKPDLKNLDLTVLQEASKWFLENAYHQTPPKFSAKKIQGNRASDLAREGVAVDLKPVLVIIRRFEIKSVFENEVTFEVECSKGTYVRVLVQDFAAKLGEVSYLKSLRRTQIGPWSVENAVSLETIKNSIVQNDSAKQDSVFIKSIDQATEFLPVFPLIQAEVEFVKQGKINDLVVRLANSGLSPNAYCARTEDASGHAIAILELREGRRAEFLRAFKN